MPAPEVGMMVVAVSTIRELMLYVCLHLHPALPPFPPSDSGYSSDNDSLHIYFSMLEYEDAVSMIYPGLCVESKQCGFSLTSSHRHVAHLVISSQKDFWRTSSLVQLPCLSDNIYMSQCWPWPVPTVKISSRNAHSTSPLCMDF